MAFLSDLWASSGVIGAVKAMTFKPEAGRAYYSLYLAMTYGALRSISISVVQLFKQIITAQATIFI